VCDPHSTADDVRALLRQATTSTSTTAPSAAAAAAHGGGGNDKKVTPSKKQAAIRQRLRRTKQLHELLETRNKYGNTALFLATLFDKTGVVRVLLEHGAQVDACDQRGKTPLMCAAAHSAAHSAATVSTLCAHKASVHVRDTTRHRRTALHHAAQCNGVAACAVLLDSRASVDARDRFEYTSLMLAAQLGHVDMCAVLLDRGARVNATKQSGAGASGGTALVQAAAYGRRDVCALLLEHKAALCATNASGETAFMTAAWNQGSVARGAAGARDAKRARATCALLLKHRANLFHRRSTDGFNALQRAERQAKPSRIIRDALLRWTAALTPNRAAAVFTRGMRAARDECVAGHWTDSKLFDWHLVAEICSYVRVQTAQVVTEADESAL
jgi:ankyrin repeat protein